MSAIDVSIIIVNYNTFDLTSKCIQSIYEKTEGCTFEVILVDNASTERPARDFLTMFPYLVLVENASNEGFSKANNNGICRSNGENILLINSDTELKNNAVAICLDVLSTNPSVGVVSARLEYRNGKVQHNCQRFPSLRASLFELLRLQKIFPPRVGGHVLFGSFFKHDEPAFPDWVWGTFFMFRKRDLKSLPQSKLDDTFFMYVEDMQWCRDFRNAGFEICFCPAAQVIHHMGGSRGPKNASIEKNTQTFMHRNYSAVHRSFISMAHKFLRR